MNTRFSVLTLIIIILTIGYAGCSSSVKTTKVSSIEEKKTKTGEKIPVEDFDITPYKTEITLKEKPLRISKESLEAWYDYPVTSTDDITQERTIVSTADGYRVRVTSTDNLEQADSLKYEVYAKTNQKQIYIIFDPPFYRIEVGDFMDISAARDLRFKLNQLGYNQAIVVNEKINVFK